MECYILMLFGEPCLRLSYVRGQSGGGGWHERIRDTDYR